MERLAPEIISNIIFHLDEVKSHFRKRIPVTPLAPLATLSRRWQPLIESITFRTLDLTSTALSSARGILTPTRLSYIRELRFRFVFPAYEIVSTRDEDWEDDHAVFTAAVNQLFSTLAQIPIGQEPLLDLEVWIPVPKKFESSDEKSDIISGRLRTIYLDIPAETNLPELPMIRNFETDLQSCSIVFSSRSVCLMASKMPRLREVLLILSDNEKIDPLVRIHQRNTLAGSLESLPSTIHYFGLSCYTHTPIDHDFHPPSILSQDEDCLSQALRLFSQREGLEEIQIQASVEPTVFWPPDSDSNSSRNEIPHWPTLKSFILLPNQVLPSGKWLFIQGPNTTAPEGSSPNNSGVPGEEIDRSYRDFPHYSLMNDFFLAAARCEAHMPKVERCTIGFKDAWVTNVILYTVFPKEPYLKVTEKSDLEINDEILDVWQNAALALNVSGQMEIEQ